MRVPVADDLRVIRQSHAQSCGAAALATYYREVLGRPMSEGEMLRRLKTRKAVDMDRLRRECRRDGLVAHGYGLDIDTLARVGRPAIVYLPGSRTTGHFAVLRGMADGRVRLADPAERDRHLARGRFVELWSGRAGGEGKALFVAESGVDWLPLTECSLSDEPRRDPDWFPVRRARIG
ncbi:C39 family peptidase [Guyparkeria sp.]|uniref:C39 family peptidase n=1 Tax=Guyparkeria sp. TaxID=2035736 RepID=UPI003970DE35